jgi:ferric-dicitrate binding protein FerR (iron transport regulator)
MNESEHTGTAGEDVLGALLAASGARATPPEEQRQQVRAAVEAEWRTLVAARQRRRRVTAWAAAAAVAVVAVSAWWIRPLVSPPAEPFASLARVQGTVEYREGRDGSWRHVQDGTRISPGAALRTGDAGRVAMELDNGVTLRLDRGTRLAFASPGKASLEAGAVYVDAGAGDASGSREFALETPFGEVRHLGTQYEARVLDAALRVAVREGRVGIALAAGGQVATAGEQLLLTGSGIERSTLSPWDSQWAWVASVTPPFEIEGRSVDEFLAWAARETGREVAYGSPDAARQAQGIVLRGSVSGLTPEQAVTAVLSTTSLQPRLETERIVVE